MIRKIIHIDEEKCNGCGLCVTACHEGAIGMVNGKAKLLRDDFCDGLGDCLPTCPVGAITFVEREAAAYDDESVQRHKRAREAAAQAGHHPHAGAGVPCGCPGSQLRQFEREDAPACAPQAPASHLRQWPVQIKLMPANAACFDDAHLLIAADCAAYACGNFHESFMRGKVTLIGCPKLDDVDYSAKLTQIIAGNEIKSVTVVRMEVPCCGGLEQAVKKAIRDSGKFLPWRVVTIGRDGRIIED